MDLSIIIPAYNEAVRLPQTLAQVKAFVEVQGREIEVIVVNDGSQDETANIVAVFAKLWPALRLINLSKNQGKGAAVRAGFLEAKGDKVLFSDADGSTPIEEVLRLEEALSSSGAEIAIGSRALRSSETKVDALYARKLVGRIFNFAVNICAVPGIKDTQCGFKLFKRIVIPALFSEQKFPRFSFDLEILYKAMKQKYKIVEVPVNWHHVTGSKVDVVRDGFRMLIDAMRLKF